MAGDWIKMRLDLQTHPKVVRILSAMRPNDVQTKTDKFRVIGGLHAVWSVFDTHSVDGRLDGYSADTLDHIIGWPGFSAAMIGVGWLEEDAQAIVLPEFSEHNGASGKRRAEDQKRKREERKCPQSVHNPSENEPDKKRTREEKRREEKDKDPPSRRFDPVEEMANRGVQPQTAEDWLTLRKAKKAPVTQTVMAQIIAEADKAGMSLERALAYSCQRGWTGFKASWVKDDPAAADKPVKKDWI